MTPLQLEVDRQLIGRRFMIFEGRPHARSQTGQRYREQIIKAPSGQLAEKIVEAICAQALKIGSKTLYWRIRPDAAGSRAYIRYLLSDKPPKAEAA